MLHDRNSILESAFKEFDHTLRFFSNEFLHDKGTVSPPTDGLRFRWFVSLDKTDEMEAGASDVGREGHRQPNERPCENRKDRVLDIC